MTTFKKMVRDVNEKLIPVGTGFSTQDETGTPKTSPLTVGATQTVLTVPGNAAEFVIVNTNNDLEVSEVTGMARYFVVPASTGEIIPCADQQFIYLKRDGGTDCTVQFRFNLLAATN